MAKTRKSALRNAQEKLNTLIELKCNELDAYLSTNEPKKRERLRTCKAWVFTYEDYYVLVSYRTTVAFINRKTLEAFDILRLEYGYTSTSAQHISKFLHDYKNTECYRWYNPEKI